MSNERSARTCGCDPGCLDATGQPYQCEQHRGSNQTMDTSLIGLVWRPLSASPVKTPDVIGPTRASTFPKDAAGRKAHPIASGVLDYFPDALVAIANVSWTGNEQHNPGQPLHWARNKSSDEADAMMRHFLERGTRDSDGIRHSAKMAWRALALLQKEIEEGK